MSQLIQVIRDRIAHSSQNKIPFAAFMDLALYHRELGYYSGGNVEIGSRGDFFTSVSLGADFGDLLAVQFAQMWQVLNQPQPFILWEMGAGLGDLALDILKALEGRYPDFYAQVEYWIVEQSPALIQRQKEVLKGYPVQWKTWSEIEDNSIVGCGFANELVDAFPVHQVRVESGELKEVYVTETKTGLTEITGELSTLQLAQYFQDMGINLLAPDYVKPYQTEVNLAAISWLETVAKKLQKGYLITIDYGYTATRYYNRERSRGTLQCYYQHRRHNNPYINLGQQDITAHVNFTALQHYGQQYGLETLGQTKQGMFLMALGLGEKLNALSSGQFGVEQILQRRDALHQLMDPTGLGGFETLIQAKGLRETEATQPLQGLTMPLF
ncbi:MAG: class I SAM-dependent methyltransferase [Spirulinaceae cyanobacterium]